MPCPSDHGERRPGAQVTAPARPASFRRRCATCVQVRMGGRGTSEEQRGAETPCSSQFSFPLRPVRIAFQAEGRGFESRLRSSLAGIPHSAGRVTALPWPCHGGWTPLPGAPELRDDLRGNPFRRQRAQREGLEGRPVAASSIECSRRGGRREDECQLVNVIGWSPEHGRGLQFDPGERSGSRRAGVRAAPRCPRRRGGRS